MIEELKKKLELEQTFLNESLANNTTLKIGGPADVFYRAKTSDQLIKAVKEAQRLSIPVTVLGGGSNVLIGDKGIRGLVIKSETREIKVGKNVLTKAGNSKLLSRWHADKNQGTFKYEFGDLDYDESGCERVKVTIDSGVPLALAINSLLDQGITGLQWYARIPGTIGGAVFNNIHGGTHFISEVVRAVRVIDKQGEVKTLSGSDLKMEYDQSRFHSFDEIILDADFELYRGDVDRARAVVAEWTKRKSIQPARSAGCTFKNISNEDKQRLNFPTTSAGYIIEHVLKMGNFQIGGAKVSVDHHNFVVNDGGAMAKDYLSVMNEIIRRTKEELGIDLVPEIICLGEF